MKNLKTTLGANAAFSASTGLLQLIFTKELLTVMALEEPIILQSIGAGLLIFSLYLAYLIMRPIQLLKETRVIVAMDFAWVFGSFILVVWNPFYLATAGLWILSFAALVVLLLALLQLKFLKEHNKKAL